MVGVCNTRVSGRGARPAQPHPTRHPLQYPLQCVPLAHGTLRCLPPRPAGRIATPSHRRDEAPDPLSHKLPYKGPQAQSAARLKPQETGGSGTRLQQGTVSLHASTPLPYQTRRRENRSAAATLHSTRSSITSATQVTALSLPIAQECPHEAKATVCSLL